MLNKILSYFRRKRSIEAEPLSFYQQGNELVVTTSEEPIGGQVKLFFPNGSTYLGKANWWRPLRGSQESSPKSLLGIQLLEKTDEFKAETVHHADVRKHQRKTFRQWVGFPRFKGLGGVTADLSMEGCRLEVDLRDHVGETHLVTLEVPKSAEVIKVKAKVLWSRHGQSGLRFLNMHIDDEALLAQSLGLPSHPARESWDRLWERSQNALSYRITRQSDEVLVLDFESPNWLATFEVEQAQTLGEWAGTFTALVNLESSTEIQELKQSLGIDLHQQRALLHLKLLNADGDTALAIWGVERAFRRTPRVVKPGGPDLCL